MTEGLADDRESIGEQSEPAGKLNLEKEDRGARRKGDEDTAS